MFVCTSMLALQAGETMSGGYCQGKSLWAAAAVLGRPHAIRSDRPVLGAHSLSAALHLQARRPAQTSLRRRLRGQRPRARRPFALIWKTDVVPAAQTIGAAYARAVAAKDYDQLRRLLAPEIDFRALTPNRTWEASDAETLIREIVQQWFDDEDEIKRLESVQTDAVGDRERVGYRFAVRNPEGDFLVEQQAYLTSRDGRIEWMRVVCSGFRPDG